MSQNATGRKSAKEVAERVDNDIRYLNLIDYRALGGLITDDDGNTRKMTVEELATALGVNRKTLYRWQETPGFWNAVNKQRKKLGSQARLSKMHNVLYLSALKPGREGHRDRLVWLANFDPNFRMPAQKVEHEAGDSLAALLSHRRRTIGEGEVIEGEVVEDAG